MKFLVDSAKKVDGFYHVGGICSEGTIYVGANFLQVYKNIFTKTPEGHYDVIDVENLRDINLKVEQIKMYGYKMDELYSGLSGELCLSSTEEIQIESEEVLAGPSNSLRD